MDFCVWLLSLSIMFLGFIHVVTYITTSFLFFFLIYFFNQSSILYTSLYTCQSQSPNLSHNHSHNPATFPLSVHMFVLNICVSISALQTGSSVPFFKVPHICVNIRYLFFSFCLTSLYMTVSRSIHVSTNNPILFLFMAE